MDRAEHQARLDELVARIEQARIAVNEHHIVQIVAVGKFATDEAIATLYDLGQRAFGENRVQNLQARQEHLADLPIAWHFIGTLQKNKINHLIDCDPFLMHSLDSLELAQALDQRLAAKGKTMECLLQVNSAKEESKSGVMPEAAKDVYAQIGQSCPNVSLKGVMSIGAHTDDEKVVQKSFEATRNIFDSLSSEGASLCSMGMSSDFELAIRCGSNMVRVGSLLFS